MKNRTIVKRKSKKKQLTAEQAGQFLRLHNETLNQVEALLEMFCSPDVLQLTNFELELARNYLKPVVEIFSAKFKALRPKKTVKKKPARARR